jgi:hypothetical protein
MIAIIAQGRQHVRRSPGIRLHELASLEQEREETATLSVEQLAGLRVEAMARLPSVGPAMPFS